MKDIVVRDHLIKMATDVFWETYSNTREAVVSEVMPLVSTVNVRKTWYREHPNHVTISVIGDTRSLTLEISDIAVKDWEGHVLMTLFSNAGGLAALSAERSAEPRIERLPDDADRNVCAWRVWLK